jgi:transcriptional regulator with XRE-family HTH domain
VRRKQPRTLAEFFEQKNAPTQDAIARQLGITGAYVSLIAAGKRQPALKLALRIEALTGVPVASLVSPEVAA